MFKKARAFFRIMSNNITANIFNSKNIPVPDPPLKYKVIAKCNTTKARVGVLTLRHGDVETPVFMPVGTQVRMIVYHLFIKFHI